MRLQTEAYQTQSERWPQTGRHILAQFDADTVVVYQAYNRHIGRYAAEHQQFGGGFRLTRMSWIKTNFFWMMARSGWGTKPDQEVTLAVRLKRDAFDALLASAVHSSFVPEVYGTEEAWRQAVEASEVRLQWDPDHLPDGSKAERRALQLGLRGETLINYAHAWIVEIEDISRFVAEHREKRSVPYTELRTPLESVYPVQDVAVAARLGVEI